MTGDPNAQPFTLVYAAAQVGWTFLIFIAAPYLIVKAGQWWRHRTVKAARSNILVFPQREATVTRIYPDRGEAS